ncbi:MAG: winged helix-turn-helix transcriptional regulator [Candidatus Saccharimonadales bacterium]
MSNSVLPTETCDVAYAMSIIGGKWKLFILWKLLGKRLRFAELRRAVRGISETVLISQLKELERDGLVKRISYHVVPPHVEYELTPVAQELNESLQQLRRWGAKRRATAA